MCALSEGVRAGMQNIGRVIMSSVITNIYNKKTKEPTLIELFTATGKEKKFFLILYLTLEYRIDVCRVIRGAQIKHL
jgi:hypothetical protein